MNEELRDLLPEEGAVPARPDYEQELLTLIRSDPPMAVLQEALAEYHDSDLADVVEQLEPEEREALYSALGTEGMSEVFAYLENVGEYIEELDAEQAADVIEGMDADDAVDVLEELDEEKRQELIDLMEPEAAEDIQLIDSYADEEIGSRMTTNFVAISKSLTVKQAMRSLIRQAAENDNITTIYALDEDDTFYGAIELKNLIIAREDADMETLIATSYPFVYGRESVSDCIERLKEYSEDSIPVLDENRHLIGVITSQDIVEVVDEELGEDYARLAGLTEEEEFDEPLLMSVRKRVPWLIVLMLMGLGVSAVVGMFENVVRSLAVIVTFQTMILSMAGNVGTQSLAVTIRALGEDERKGHARRLIFKELRVGMVNGLLLGVFAFAGVGLYLMLVRGEAPAMAFMISGCIGLALLAAMTISGITGTVIPIALHKLHLDPAAASGPLISTVNDLVAVVTYYGLAWTLLIQLFRVV